MNILCNITGSSDVPDRMLSFFSAFSSLMGGVVMLTDIVIGSVLYVLVSICFGREFEGSFLALSIVFAVLPDIDLVPYFGIKKASARLLKSVSSDSPFRKWLSSGENMVTHHLIHFPLFFVVIALFMWWLTESSFTVALFLCCSWGHLLHDAFTTPQGIQVFFPIHSLGCRLSRRGIRWVSRAEREEIFDLRREEYRSRSLGIGGELRVRMESVGQKTRIAVLFALALVIVFKIFS